MRKFFKWAVIILGGLIGLLALVAVVLSFLGSAQLKQTKDIQVEALVIPTDEASLARGEHLVTGPGLCTECHGKDLGGDIIIQEASIGTIYAPNITGLSATHNDDDLVRAIRHGVDRDGRRLIAMPSDIYINLSAEDLGAIIAYLKQVPKIDNNLPEPELTFTGRIMLEMGMFGEVFPAEYTDHSLPFPNMPEIGANLEYGEYLSLFCKKCHQEDLAGGIFDPDAPAAPNLTPGGELGKWSEADFIRSMRTGVSPEGDKIDSESMPWEGFARFNDDELKGLWMYLQSTPAVSD